MKKISAVNLVLYDFIDKIENEFEIIFDQDEYIWPYAFVEDELATIIKLKYPEIIIYEI